MTEEEARKKLTPWQHMDLRNTDGTNFIDYHIKKIKDKGNGQWDDLIANEQITLLIMELESEEDEKKHK